MSEEQRKSTTASESLFPEGLEGILANPELLRTLGTLIGSLSAGKSEKSEPVSEDLPSPSPVSSIPTDGLSLLLSNPEMMEKLPEIIATIKPLIGNGAPPVSGSGDREKKTSVGKRDHARDQLLLSLKPFLSQNRCDAIDTMIRISTLSHVFQQLK